MKKIGWNIKSQILILIYEISGSFDTAVDNNLESLFNIVLIVEFSPVFFHKTLKKYIWGVVQGTAVNSDFAAWQGQGIKARKQSCGCYPNKLCLLANE